MTAGTASGSVQGQRSPTLSIASMILPAFDASFGRSFSPGPYLQLQRPPSPPDLHPSAHVILPSAPQGRHYPHHEPSSYSHSSRSSPSSTLHAMTLASLPTVGDVSNNLHPPDWNAHDRRNSSSGSSSIHSEDLDNWPGFDGLEPFDDSGVHLDDREKSNGFSGTKVTGHDVEADPWPAERTMGSDEDDEEISSAALSQRAEMILANAKKRLNVMEGNLRGARESLVVSPTFGFASQTTDLSHYISVARERDRRLYAGMGPIPPRNPPYRSSPLSLNATQNHARGLSETSVLQPFTTSYKTRSTTSKRSSSAMGHRSGPWSSEGYGQGRFPIKESRSIEVLRNPHSTWGNEPNNAARSNSRGPISPPSLETLQEDEDATRLQRSSSAASGLRDQMNDLKGRISSLKLKAQEDHLRRQSLQSLRTPSPFTSAETWYSGTNDCQSGGAPVTDNAGVGVKSESPARQMLYQNEYERNASPMTTSSQHEGEELVTYDQDITGLHCEPDSFLDMDEEDAEGDAEGDAKEDAEEDAEEDADEEYNYVFADGEDENEEQATADSVYEDAVYEMSATARHEDRIDAFDYENFFLHSAMGTYSLEGGRRGSTSSDSSTATTRPVTAVQNQEDEDNEAEKRISIHQRNPSADSISTVASFATAVEQASDDEDEENEQMDYFSQQIIAPTNSVSSRSGTLGSLRSDSAINMRRAAAGSSPTQTSMSRGSTSPGDVATGLETLKMLPTLNDDLCEESRLSLSEEETQLIHGLAASFQQIYANLQSTHSDAYERKAWRRRLDEARRILDGEETEDDQSF